MSTRAHIIITGNCSYNSHTVLARTTRLYKGSDGYPREALKVIGEALKRSFKQNSDAAKAWKDKAVKPVGVQQLVGNTIGADTNGYGMHTSIDVEFDHGLEASVYGPADVWIEWVYTVDLYNKTVSVARNPVDASKGLTVNPESYAEQLYPEAQDNERKRIRAAVKAIEALGFSVNPEPKTRNTSKRKTA